MHKKILVAGIGNVLFSDEGVGVHLVRQLVGKKLPKHVTLAEIGTCSIELIRAMSGKDKVIIVDAMLSNEPPGTVYRLANGDLKSQRSRLLTNLHQFGLIEALLSAKLLGTRAEIVIFGISPKDYKTLSMKLTPQLSSSLPKIVQTILKEISE